MPIFLIAAIDPHNEFASRIMETSSIVRGILRPRPNAARSCQPHYGYGIGQVATLGPIVLRREFSAAAFGVLRDSFGGYQAVLGAAALCTTVGAIVLTLDQRTSFAQPA